MAALQRGLDLGPAVVDGVPPGDHPVVDQQDDQPEQDRDGDDADQESQGRVNLSRQSASIRPSSRISAL
jgi:hypothetical protein